MRLTLDSCVLRSWQRDDAPSLARHANNRKIWLNLRDAFPHPYSGRDAEAYIAAARSGVPETRFAIEIDGEAAGSIGFRLGADVERVGAEVGYWVSERHWGRGIATEALAALTRHAMEAHELLRVFALPFAWSAASIRVLEKCGYEREGRLRSAAVKDGRVVDQILYARIAPRTGS
jgi:RimJ/RimL family protein N-acetyltransferase